MYVVAVKFIWNCCVESMQQLKKEEGSGCILAHCMGLGKTLSVGKFNYMKELELSQVFRHFVCGTSFHFIRVHNQWYVILCAALMRVVDYAWMYQ